MWQWLVYSMYSICIVRFVHSLCTHNNSQNLPNLWMKWDATSEWTFREWQWMRECCSHKKRMLRKCEIRETRTETRRKWRNDSTHKSRPRYNYCIQEGLGVNLKLKKSVKKCNRTRLEQKSAIFCFEILSWDITRGEEMGTRLTQ